MMTRSEVKKECERIPPAELKQASLPETAVRFSQLDPRVPFWIDSLYLQVGGAGSVHRVLATVNGVETSSEIFRTEGNQIFAVFTGFPGQKFSVGIAVILNE